MKTISVNATKRDVRVFGIQKYDNDEPWNIDGGLAPNGVCATRYMRRTSPDTTKLTALAVWLFDHCPTCVAGKMPHPQSQYRVRCFNGKTQADIMREQRPGTHTENMIRAYDLETRPAAIDDYLFPIINPKQTDEEYWNSVAAHMLDTGINRIVIGIAEWRA